MILESHIVNEEIMRCMIRSRDFSLLAINGFELTELDVQLNIVYYHWTYKAAGFTSFGRLRITCGDHDAVLLYARPCPLVLNGGDTLHINYSLEWRADDWTDDDVTLPIPPDVSISFDFCLCA